MHDVLVIEGGNAALCAALMAREAGASVLPLEAPPPREWRGGNSPHTRNLRCMHDAPQDGCNEADDRFTLLRRRFHHLTFPHPLHGDPQQRTMDRAFIVLLFATSLTGLALLAWRDTSAMAVLLAIHLGTVLALFLTLPYGRFAHAVYRSAALLKWAVERRQPNRLQRGAG